MKNVRLTTLKIAIVSALAGTLFASAPAQAAVPLEDFAPYQGQVSCDPTVKPGTLAFSNVIMNKFGGGSSGITRSCSIGGLSEHKEGRAFDWRINASSAADRTRAQKAIRWLTAEVRGEQARRARSMGVMYIIWNRKMWRAYDPSAGWQPYTGASPHTDHMHISLSWSGAMKETSRWTANPVFDYGPCARWVGEMASPWKAPRLTPCPEPLKRPKANANGYYVAQQNETVRRVARFFDRTPLRIRQLNSYPTTGYVEIREGQKILVRG